MNKLQRALPVLLLLCWLSSAGGVDNSLLSKRSVIANHIITQFPNQLTNPQKKDRKSFSQFGYNLYLVNFPLFPITGFIKPDDFGVHSYGQPGAKERNGVLYTCRGGFIDFSHVRPAADWTVYLAFKIITEKGDFNLPDVKGSLKLHFNNLEALTFDDIISIAQKIAFERLTWHEVVSWYHHPPNDVLSEQTSSFTPEDTYSNFIGTLIGKNIALRILNNFDNTTYEQIATEEIEKMVKALEPVTTIRQSKAAYDIVDLNKQLRLPEDKRNNDVWWSSKVEFSDARYMFKRDMEIGPQISPWLVPQSNLVGCAVNVKPFVIEVPQKAGAGISLYKYYQFTISPDSLLFYNKRTGKELFTPFQTFSTHNFQRIIRHVAIDMEKKLLPGFDMRNSVDPTPNYKHLRKVFFK